MFFEKFGRKALRLSQVLDNPKLFTIRRRGVGIADFLRLNVPWLTRAGIRSVIDVGANTGQFACLIHELIPTAIIYCFEPLPDCFQELTARMSSVSNFKAYNLALGDVEGVIEFYRSSFTPASSPKRMASLHKINFPFSSKEEKIKVKASTLDKIFVDVQINKPLLIKIDVQGFEDKVLLGGQELLKKATFVIVETSFEVLYEGQPLFHDIFAIMQNMGFDYRGNLDQLFSPIDGSILQADSLFVAKDKE